MSLENFNRGYVGLKFLLTFKMGHKWRKIEHHWSRRRFAVRCYCADVI